MPTQELLDNHTREIASVRRPAWQGIDLAERVSPHIAHAEGFALWGAAPWRSDVYAFFDQMLDRDPHLFSILQTRKNGLLARPRKIEPAAPEDAHLQVADWVDRTLDALPHWDQALEHLLDSLARGMAVLEIVWGFDAAGRVVPAALKPRQAGRFSFGSGGELLLTDFDSAFDGVPYAPATAAQTNAAANGSAQKLGQRGDANRLTQNPAPLPGMRTRRLPDRKFIVLLHEAGDGRPYGKGLLERVYWHWWFKKNNLRFWAIYNERFGSPTVVARHDAQMTPEERDRLLEVIRSLQTEAGVTIPDGIALDLLESNRRGSADTYRMLQAWCNDEMTRAVLGQTLTTGEGQRSGSLALGRVHELVRFDYIRTDACMLADAVNSQLIRWMIDFNFGTDFPSPRWTVDLAPEVDREVEVRIDRQLLQMGVSLPLRYFYDKYGRPPAADGERLLRYDDSNLYQYHLQFGVLTVNEVRASLGLPPVEWGNRPTSPAETPRHPAPSPRGSAGGVPLSESPQVRVEREREAESDRDDEEQPRER